MIILWILYLMFQSYILDLLNPHCAEKRVIHKIFGNLGELFMDLNAPIAIPKGSNKLRLIDLKTGQYQVFDTQDNKWLTLNQELLDSIPKTYTYAPRPQNVDMELDYFVRGCGLVKHHFIWSVDALPKDDFAKITSNTNIAWRGRYTMTPWMPRIQNLGRMSGGFYELDNDDWAKIYG